MTNRFEVKYMRGKNGVRSSKVPFSSSEVPFNSSELPFSTSELVISSSKGEINSSEVPFSSSELLISTSEPRISSSELVISTSKPLIWSYHEGHEEHEGVLVDIEYNSRKNNRLKRLIKKATFDQPQACVADINYSAGRKLNKSQIESLSTCFYVAENHNIIIMGAAGSGKSYLACAFGMEACKQFYTVKYVRLPELLVDLTVARGQGDYKRVLTQYTKVNLLILDEWMLVSLTETEARDLLEITHARHKRASTIFCSQFAPAGWYGKLAKQQLLIQYWIVLSMTLYYRNT